MLTVRFGSDDASRFWIGWEISYSKIVGAECGSGHLVTWSQDKALHKESRLMLRETLHGNAGEPACGAGDSVKPGVKRGGTPG